ncbi:V/A-type H+-transporting ATPase subunit C [Enterococcus sp. PF1-24]|uniref:V-type ATPase subunit n=1 Tax=unclassified Enterococcus TaxID=2608891 RepID=UPI00247365D0|nr:MULTISPECIES: V-type ATPase subunit [unclassified Enterococcus]MDH6364766.1 V/A-type H+-transporting ATPase subunit C [Enterococcus sp. PFB1-1]MDH6401889.1 V/A-type H+-transporting ATPase subunit C [Enterococcus sp. PF1-24]
MVKQASYHELNPLIRGKELELLPADLFERLIQAATVAEVGEILRGTYYSSLIYPNFDYDFDKNIEKDQEELFSWLVATAPEKEVIWVYTMRFTFHNLKVLTKAEMLQKNFDNLFVADGFYDIQELKEAIRTGESERLPESLMKNIQEVQSYFGESKVLQGIDVIYDRQFLAEQRNLGEKLGYPELLQEIIAFIDLTNINTLARGIQQNRSIAFMTTVLSSSGGIAKEALLDLVEADPAVFVQFIRQTEYGELLAPALQGEQIDFVQLERLKDDYLTDMYQLAQTQAFGPLPLLAFLNAKEVERKNLQLIVSGKRSGIDATVIRERMRKTYGA